MSGLKLDSNGSVLSTSVDAAVLEYLQQNNKDIDGVDGITMADVDALGIELTPNLDQGEISFTHNGNYPVDAEEVIAQLNASVSNARDAATAIFQQSVADVLTQNGFGDLIGEDGSLDLNGLMSKLDSGEMSTEQLIFMMIQLLEDAKEKLSKNGINMLEFEQSNLDAENEKMLENILDEIKNLEKAEKSSRFMQIFGWIALVVTAPALLAAGPGGWVVLAAMLAFQIDSTFFEGKMMEGIAEHIVMPIANNLFGADITKEEAVLATSIIIAVVMVVASCGVGAGGAASSLDDIAKGAAKLADDAAGLADDAVGIADDVAQAADDVARASKDVAKASDDLASAQEAFKEASKAASKTSGKSADEIAQLNQASDDALKALGEAQEAAGKASDDLAAYSKTLKEVSSNTSFADEGAKIAKDGARLGKDLSAHTQTWADKFLLWSNRLQVGVQAAQGGVAIAHAFNERDLANTQAEAIDIQAAISAIQQMIDDLMDLLTLVQESKAMGDEVVATFLQDLFKTKSMPWRNSV